MKAKIMVDQNPYFAQSEKTLACISLCTQAHPQTQDRHPERLHRLLLPLSRSLTVTIHNGTLASA